MSTSPYVSRHPYRKDKIVIGEREFDGIDHPNYESKMALDPDEARYVGQELLKLAEAIDGKSKKDRTYAKVRKNTLAIAKAAKKEAMA